jgi:tetratricopeptide (TPR) repeat protein
VSIDSRTEGRWAIAPALAAALAPCLALRAGFVWLDHAHIEKKLAVASPSSWIDLFRQGFAGTGYYRPLVAISLSIDALAKAPWFFHATNLAWHAAASLFVTRAAEELGLTKRAALFAGVLFAVHPATGIVANAIAFRSEAMLVVALLGLVVAHLRAKPLAAAIALLAGALTKETALALGPLFIVALEVERRLAGRAGAASKSTFAAEAGALAMALALRAAYAPSWRAEHPDLSISEAIGTRLASMARAAAAIVVPVDRSVCDASRIESAATLSALAGLVVVLAVAWLAFRRRGPALLLALSMLPILQIVPVPRWWSLHYVYVPLAFATMLVAERVDRSNRPRAPWLAVAAALLLGGVSLIDSRRFASDAALWEPEIAADAACLEGQFYAGEAARIRGDLSAAIARYEAALSRNPRVLAYVDRRAALQNLAVTLLESNDAEAAWLILEPEIAREDASSDLIYLAAKAANASGNKRDAQRLILRLRQRGWTGSAPAE